LGKVATIEEIKPAASEVRIGKSNIKSSSESSSSDSSSESQ
jgi:hypothetical protein